MKKEKILINIENLDDYYEYKKIGYNNFLFAMEYFSIGYKTFSIDEINELECNKFLLINRVFDTKDIKLFKCIIDKLNCFNGIIFEDIGVFNLLKDKNILLIWNQNHFGTNYSSINYWLDMVSSAVISNELTYSEIKKILDESKKPLVLNIFGKNQIMYSRRSLLTNFNTYFNIKKHNDVILEEPITNNEFNALESDMGTVIFNNEYFDITKYDFLDSKILYYLVYPKGISVKDINDIIEGKNKNAFSDGFMNKKTIYKLGDKNGRTT